jgi:hypothetical protein
MLTVLKIVEELVDRVLDGRRFGPHDSHFA